MTALDRCRLRTLTGNRPEPTQRDPSVTSLRIANLDQRVEAMLADPDRYFTAARERAWIVARLEIDLDLARRARARQTNHRLARARPARSSSPPQRTRN